MKIKFLHTGDIHLGRKFTVLGEKGRLQREQLKETFARIVRLAIEEKVDLLLICGDLFDSQIPPLSTVEFVIEQFQILEREGIFVCLIAGTHDCLDPRSIYRKIKWAEICPGLTLFNESTITKEFPHLGLTVWGRSLLSGQTPRNPLSHLGGEKKSPYQVGMIHGSYYLEGKIDPRDPTFTRQEIEDSGFNYLALGHWHRTGDYSVGGVKAFYSGAPEMVDVGEGEQGNVLLVEIEDSETRVNLKLVGRRHYRRLELMAEDFPSLGKLKERIMKEADPDLALDVIFIGLQRWNQNLNFDLLQEEIEKKIFRLRLLDRSHLRITPQELVNYPENLIIGKFIHLMEEKIYRAENEDLKKIAEEALQYGVSLLEGREVLG